MPAKREPLHGERLISAKEVRPSEGGPGQHDSGIQGAVVIDPSRQVALSQVLYLGLKFRGYVKSEPWTLQDKYAASPSWSIGNPAKDGLGLAKGRTWQTISPSYYQNLLRQRQTPVLHDEGFVATEISNEKEEPPPKMQ